MSLDISTITGCETLYRAVKPIPMYIKENGEISSAIFKDSQGVSVDRDGERTFPEISQCFLDRFEDVIALANLTVSDVLEEPDLTVEPDPLQENEFHALIIGATRTQLKSSQAKKLMKKVSIIRFEKD